MNPSNQHTLDRISFKHCLKLSTLIVAMFVLQLNAFSQRMSINTDGSLPDSSAMLDIKSTTQGFLMPRMTTAQQAAIVNPAEGLMIYNIDSNGFYFYDGTQWTDGGPLTSTVTDSIDENIFSARISNTGTIISQSQDFVSSVTKNATGDYTVNFQAGFFTQAPSVTATVNSTGANDRLIANANSISTTSVRVHTDQFSTSVDVEFTLTVIRQGSDYRYNTTSTSIMNSATEDSTRLTDADGDTRIEVDETGADQDIISFYNGGTEFIRIDSGRIEFKNTGRSILIGSLAGKNSSYTTTQNVFVGHNAGFENTTGTNNIAIGYQSGYNGTTANENVNIGSLSGYSQTDNFREVNVGYEAGYNQVSSYQNLNLGYQSNYYNVDGINNVILGSQAGRGTALHSKSGNIFIGFQAGYNDTTENKLYIENSNSSTPLVYGDFANDSLKIYGNLSIGDEYSFPSADGTNGQVLQTNGSGNVTWETHASSPWILDNDTVSVLSKRVGIGMSNPANLLHIRGNATQDVMARFERNPAVNGTSGAIEIVGARQANVASNDIAYVDLKNFDANESGGTEYIMSRITGFASQQTGQRGGIKMYINNGSGGLGLIPMFQINHNGEAKFGTDSLSGSISLVSDQGATDYNVSFTPSNSMTQNTVYTLPPDDGDASEVLLTDGSGNLTWETPTATLAGGSATKLARWTNASTLDTSLITDNGLTVGVNTAPAATDLFRSTTNDASIFRALSGIHSLSSSDISYGVYGSSSSSDNNNAAGVYGTASNGAVAVYGQSNSSLSGTVAVKGWNSASGSNQNYGVKGQTSSTHPSSAGIYGFGFHGGNAILAESNARVIEAESYGTRTTSFNAIELNNLATSSTASIIKTGLNIQSTGAWSGASAQNIGLNVNVDGGTTNFAALFNGGNVGIGTDDPIYKLDIAGSLRTWSSWIEGTGVGFTGTTVLDTSGNNRVSFSMSGSSLYNNALTLGTYLNGVWTNPFIIKRGAPTGSMFIDSLGLVGIGTTAPSSAFEVDGIFTVSGNGGTPLTIQTGFDGNTSTTVAWWTTIDGPAGIRFMKSVAVDDNFYIGGSNNLMYADVDADKIGIGTSNPAQKLHLYDSGSETAMLFNNSSTGSGLQDGLYVGYGSGAGYMWNYEASSLILGTSDSERMRILSNGNVGIGTTSPAQKLDVAGNIAVNGSTVHTSDRRLKTDIEPILNVLSTLDSITGVYHYWDTINFPERNYTSDRALGVIAQDIQKVYPELVLTDNNGYLSVDYSKFTAVLLQAIKEQQREIEFLTNENESNSTRIDELYDIISAIANKSGIDIDQKTAANK